MQNTLLLYICEIINIMNCRLIPVLLLSVVINIFVVSSCRNKTTQVEGNVIADSIIARYADSIYVNPAVVGERYSEAQKHVSDSVGFYKLELFKGISALLCGNIEQYKLSHELAADYLKRNPTSYVVAGTYWNHEGMVQNSRGNVDSAIVCYEKSSEMVKHIEDWSSYSTTCINLADAYRSKGDMVIASKYYRRALYVADSVNVHTHDFSILSGLGSIYSDMGNYEQSDLFFEKARPLVEKASDFDAFFYYNSVGNSLYFQKKYDEALAVFYKAYEIAEKSKQQDLYAIVETNLGEVMMFKGVLDSARYYLKSAEKRFMAMPSIDESTKFYLNSILAGLCLREDNMSEVKQYLSVKVDTTVLRPKYIALHYGRLRDYYVKKNDYRRAFEYEQLATKYEDEINTDKVRTQMSEIRYRYTQDTTLLSRDLMIKAQSEKMEVLSMWNYAAGVAIVLILIIVCLYLAYRKKKELVSKLKMECSLMLLRMENIRNRVSPHFIFNVLNRELAIQNEGVNRLVKLLRMNLDLCDRYIISLREEIDFINIYVGLERKALGSDFKYILDVDKTVDLDKLYLPSMMIQIFVENALKHGLRGRDFEKILRLTIKQSENMLAIHIENNGSNHGVVAGKIGTGLKVVMQTIHILNERNNEKIKLKYGMNEETGMWCVDISIPDGYDFSIMQ